LYNILHWALLWDFPKRNSPQYGYRGLSGVGILLRDGNFLKGTLLRMVVVWGQGVLVTVSFPRPVIAEGIVRQAIAECFIGACFHVRLGLQH